LDIGAGTATPTVTVQGTAVAACNDGFSCGGGDSETAARANGSAIVLDTALLEATRPLIRMVNGSMTTNDSVVNLVQKAKLEAGGASEILNLNNSSLTILNGSLFNVAASSRINALNLVTMLNSNIFINNGLFLNLTGNSIVNVSNALVNFTNTSNVIRVNNGIAPNAFLGTIPIHNAGTLTGTNANGRAFQGCSTCVNVVSGSFLNVAAGSTLKIGATPRE